MLLFTVLYVVFTQIFRLGDQIPHYPAYLLLGIVLWTFFAETTSMGMSSIVGRGDLIRKVKMPKYIIPVSTTLSAFINLILNLVVVFGFLLLTGVPLRPEALLAPVFLLELVVFAMAISFLLSALYVKYRDFAHIWDVALQALFYATPILYPLSLVPPTLAKILVLNPVAQAMQNIRYLIITPATTTPQQVLPPLIGWLAPLAIVAVALFLSAWYFRSRSKNFAENI